MILRVGLPSPPGAEALQFRDIEAFAANRAVALSIGGGTGPPMTAARSTR
ncbi:hypothetical protein ABZW11_33490 [Nonomuraea sp. NPDC004580]